MLGERFNNMPVVVKNLLIINGLFFLAKMTWPIYMDRIFALHPFQSPDFKEWQIITHMFMHGNFTHLLLNMFAVWMFGKVLENVWGAKRFLNYYMITGLGAMILYVGVQQVQISVLESEMSTEKIESLSRKTEGGALQEYGEFIEKTKRMEEEGLAFDYNTEWNKWVNKHKIDQRSYDLVKLYSTPILGASGALFGLLLAFGMLFPNTLLYLYFAIPLKAKYFVLGYGILELVLTFVNTNDGVAHLAHLGGMLFGFLIIKYWKKDRNTFY